MIDFKTLWGKISIWKILFIVLVILVCVFVLTILTRTPSTDRVWSLDQNVLPYAEFENGLVHIKNIRNFTYASTTSYTPSYYDKTVAVSDVTSVDYIVEPLSGPGAAHTLLSFGFIDGSRIAISVEIRKEMGETFSPFLGLVRSYELMYVIADERDVLELRALHRKDPVYIYPTTASKEDVERLFVDMLTRTNKLKHSPEFYNTLTSTCTTNIVEHINAIREERIGFDYRILLPKNSDVLAQELGFIDNTMPIEELREIHLANSAIEEHSGKSDFSTLIRSQYSQ